MSNNNPSSKESNPQKESNEAKGKPDLYKNTEPQKKISTTVVVNTYHNRL